jgi:hypothetical protein
LLAALEMATLFWDGSFMQNSHASGSEQMQGLPSCRVSGITPLQSSLDPALPF